jgi:hypothetical protein
MPFNPHPLWRAIIRLIDKEPDATRVLLQYTRNLESMLADGHSPATILDDDVQDADTIHRAELRASLETLADSGHFDLALGLARFLGIPWSNVPDWTEAIGAAGQLHAPALRNSIGTFFGDPPQGPYQRALEHIAAGNLSPNILFAQKILEGVPLDAAHRAEVAHWK